MPNWCSNVLTVSGEPAEVRRFIDACMGLPADWPLEKWKIERGEKKPVYTDKYFSFNALVPVPKEVIDFGYDRLPVEDTMKVLCGENLGLLDGYHWCLENWGTKRDVYSGHYTADDFTVNGDGAEVSLDFSTAWSPATEWMHAASKQFPELSFTLEYAEPGYYFGGRFVCQNGEVEEDHKYSDEELREFFSDDDEDAADDEDDSPNDNE